MARFSETLRSAARRLGPVRDWLSTHPRSVSILALCAVALAGLHLWVRAAEIYGGDPLPPPDGTSSAYLVFKFVRESYFFGLWLLAPVLLLALVRARRDGPPLKPVAIASAAVFAVWVASEIATHGTSKLELAGVEPSPWSGLFRLLLTGGLILSPPFLVWRYSRSPLLSRYVLRQFLVPFAYCFIGFIAIWLVIDLSDNGPDFFEADAPLGPVVKFYVVQIPQIVVMILPITLLLALLYSLGKMSKSNEMISMLTAGKSLPKVLMPLFFVGFYSSLVTLALNYEWAPEAEGHKESLHDDLTENAGERRATDISVRAQHYRNREDHRTWFVGRIPFDLAMDKLRNLEIYQYDEDGNTRFVYFASKAGWIHSTGEWRLINGRRFDYSNDQRVPRQYGFVEEVIAGWRETPWKIYSESLVPEHMGVPGLAFHIQTNSDKPAKLLAPFRTHWHYRWALPWSCLAITLVAAPLGIVFSRRGIMGGVAGAIFIFFGMLVLTNLFLALGQGMHLPAFLGAWAINFILAGIGLWLLYLRSNNREIPKPSLAGLRNWVTGLASRDGRSAARRRPSATRA